MTDAIKNALDWMVGNEPFVNKPVAFMNASPHAIHTQATLRETAYTMSVRIIVDEACIMIPFLAVLDSLKRSVHKT